MSGIDAPYVTTDRRMVFAEVVSVDAWYDALALDGSSSGVYADLTFREGYLGGEDDDLPVTFRVRLKRALVKIIVEHPLKIDRASVARPSPEFKLKFDAIHEARADAKSRFSAGLGISPDTLKALVKAKLTASSSQLDKETTRISHEVPRHLVTPVPISELSYAWDVEPSYENHLIGQPWDAQTGVRLKVGLTKSSKIDPAIRIEVTCRNEDIDVFDLKVKSTFSLASFNARKEAVARTYIKSVLIKNGLHPAKLDNRFSQVVLASVIASLA